MVIYYEKIQRVSLFRQNLIDESKFPKLMAIHCKPINSSWKKLFFCTFCKSSEFATFGISDFKSLIEPLY